MSRGRYALLEPVPVPARAGSSETAYRRCRATWPLRGGFEATVEASTAGRGPTLAVGAHFAGGWERAELRAPDGESIVLRWDRSEHPAEVMVSLDAFSARYAPAVRELLGQRLPGGRPPGSRIVGDADLARAAHRMDDAYRESVARGEERARRPSDEWAAELLSTSPKAVAAARARRRWGEFLGVIGGDTAG